MQSATLQSIALAIAAGHGRWRGPRAGLHVRLESAQRRRLGRHAARRHEPLRLRATAIRSSTRWCVTTARRATWSPTCCQPPLGAGRRVLWRATSPRSSAARAATSSTNRSATTARAGATSPSAWASSPARPEFHRLKKGFVPTYDRWARPITLDDDLRTRLSRTAARARRRAASRRQVGQRQRQVSRHGKSRPWQQRQGQQRQGQVGRPARASPARQGRRQRQGQGLNG